MRVNAYLFTALILAPGFLAGQTRAEDDIVFRAMQDELDRSMTELKLDDAKPPYFLSYAVRDNEKTTVQARYGSLVDVENGRSRSIYVDVRVGSPKLDNGSFVGTWQDMHNMRTDTVEEDDYGALRHDLWIQTDRAYKNAMENLARKRAYLQSHPPKHEIPDFSEAEPLVLEEEVGIVEVDLGTWEANVRDASRTLQEFASLQDWRVTFQRNTIARRFLNSEGSRHRRSATLLDLEISATALAEDGQRLTAMLTYTTRDGDPLPVGASLLTAVRKMAGELEAMVAAEPLDEYAGPVLFSDFSAAQFTSQLFMEQLSPTKTPIVTEDWMKERIPDPKLAGRLNRRVLPEFVAVSDLPTQKEWRGHRLAGYRIVDDEAVRTDDLTLVQDGRLVTLPMGRQPTKKLPDSNGHSLTLPNQWTVPVATSIFVETAEPNENLVEELRDLCRRFDNEFGLLVRQLEEPRIAHRYVWMDQGEDSPGLLSAPVIVYKVYAEDGRLEPVRGLLFDEVSIRTLRDIVALGNEPRLTNLWQPIDRLGFSYPASIVTPDILVEEMECKANAMHEPMPVSGRPMAEN